MPKRVLNISSGKLSEEDGSCSMEKKLVKGFELLNAMKWQVKITQTIKSYI